MALTSDSGNGMVVKFSVIHELVEEALVKLQILFADLLQDDKLQDYESRENEQRSFRSAQEAQIRPISSHRPLTSERPFTGESGPSDVAYVTTNHAYEDLESGEGIESFVRTAEDDSEHNSISTASSLWNLPHRAWEVDIFLKDAELSVEKRMESHEDGTLIEGWIGDLKAQRLKLKATQQQTLMQGRRAMEAVRKVQVRLVEIEAAYGQSQKRETNAIETLTAIKEEMTLLQATYRKCAIENHALKLQLGHENEVRAEEIKRLNEAFDSMIVRHKAEVSSLRLENTRMKNSNERNVAALKDELISALETRVPKEQFDRLEKQSQKHRIAMEEAQEESLTATQALAAERRSRIEEIQRADQNQLRAQQNTEIWQKRYRQVGETDFFFLLFVVTFVSAARFIFEHRYESL